MEMLSKMNSDYFYNSDADQFSFIKVPKLLVTGDDFSSVSIPAKILYGMLLDRMAIAMKNKWMDEKGRIYILYQLSEIQEDMNISRRKACDSLQELVNEGLVQKFQSGKGPTRIYVKNFAKRL